MAAATISRQEITMFPGVSGKTWVEQVIISSLGAGSPSTFTTNLASIEGVHVSVNKAGAGAHSVSWSGRTVSITFASPADDGSKATVTVYGQR